MTTVRVTIHWAGPLIMPRMGPLVPDSWLTWAQTMLTHSFPRMPQDPDWIENVPLPLAVDPVSGLWAISALTFPAPGVVTSNTGYRNGPNSGDPTNHVHLFSDTEASSGIYRAVVYDLTSWFTPRAVFWAELPEDPEAMTQFQRLLTILRYSGVGSKRSDGYGAIRAIDLEEDSGRSAVWSNGMPLRPIPVSSVRQPLDAPKFVFKPQGPRWRGAASICYGPPLETWRPRVDDAALHQYPAAETHDNDDAVDLDTEEAMIDG